MQLRGLTAFVLAVLGPQALAAQDPLEFDSAAAESFKDDWGLAVTPYAFLAAQSTDVGGQALRQSFNDLASITNFGFQARVLARWRWLTFIGDLTYAELSSAKEIGPVKADIAIDQSIVDMKLGGRVYDSRNADQSGGVAVWTAIGARHWKNDVTVETETRSILPGQPPRVDTTVVSQEWWDPVLGLWLGFPVTPKVSFLVRATGGGLSIGNASKYMWDTEFAALFALSRRFVISAGYRQFKYSRTEGEGDDAVDTTVSVVGPAVGFSIGIF